MVDYQTSGDLDPTEGQLASEATADQGEEGSDRPSAAGAADSEEEEGKTGEGKEEQKTAESLTATVAATRGRDWTAEEEAEEQGLQLQRSLSGAAAAEGDWSASAAADREYLKEELLEKGSFITHNTLTYGSTSTKTAHP